jgi:hypothetical protein
MRAIEHPFIGQSATCQGCVSAHVRKGPRTVMCRTSVQMEIEANNEFWPISGQLLRQLFVHTNMSAIRIVLHASRSSRVAIKFD